jgi:CheY-like chemotaxis protein
MGQKTVRFSDLSGQLITQDEALTRIVVHEHPELDGGAVEIEALADEALAMEKHALNVAVLDLHLPGEEEPRRVVIDADEFAKMATERPASELLIAARPAKKSRAGTSRAAAAKADRPDYATLEHAGKPHRGKATEAEQALVRENLDQINERLQSEGLRTIDPGDPEHAERYGLAGAAGQAAETESE